MLSPDEYRQLDGVAMAQLIREKQITPSELFASAMLEMDRANPSLNAIVHCNASLALNLAKNVSTDLPLAGVPFPAKDINVHVQGLPLRHACRFFDRAPVSDHDSQLAMRWREAGLIIFGRTNTPEFATDYGCESEYYGPANNPWNHKLTPGGSSGGAAAAVASGIVPMAHASDSGGSIRVPAACCGVFGYKPTSGLVATGSSFGPLVNGLNCDHVICWSVRDSAAMLDATAGPEAGAPTAYSGPEGSYHKQLETPPGKLVIAIAASAPNGVTPVPEYQTFIDATINMLEALGHRIVPWQWPVACDACEAATLFWAGELAAMIESYAKSIDRQPRRSELGPVVRWAIARALQTNALALAQAQEQLARLRQSMVNAMAGIDIVLSPVIAEPPIPTGLLTDIANDNVDDWMERAWQFAPYPEIFNATGQPAMSVPLYQSANGLPVAMHFAGNVGQDLLLLRLARQLEQALPWHARRPPLADTSAPIAANQPQEFQRKQAN